jgi:dienelactone hydrolase
MAAAASGVVLTAAQVPAAAPAVEVLGTSPAGLKDGWAVVDRGGLSFSDDGLKLTVATAPVPPPGNREPTEETPQAQTPPTGAPAGGPARTASTGQQADPNRVNLDLWHWKDESIQPMQQVRSRQDRARTYKAVVFLDTKEFKHLDSKDVTIAVPDHGDWGLASSDLRFRGQNWLSPSPRDYTLVNIRTGSVPKEALLPGQEFAPFRSPKGAYLVAYDGKHWHSLAVPDGKKVNLTGKIASKFFNEEYDSPATPSPYGMSGFSSDERYVLLSDKYDVWKVALDGSSAENLTKVGREQHVRFRINRFADPDDRDEPGVNLSKPLFLSATNLDTYDTGFYRLDPGAKPKLLVMGARQYGQPTKARKADTYVFTVSTFSDYPDYYVADKDFTEVKRVTDVNPKVKEFNWGKAELVGYRSVDGVPLKGVLIKPEDFDPTKQYPMMVYIYERLSQNIHRYVSPSAGTSINPTFYASNGYLVYMPDIAYTVGMPGQSALKCVLPAIQAVVDKGYVKEDAIGIQGHSWGGYQIAYLVTQTNRFKAASAGAPVSNMTSAYGGIRWSSGMSRQFQYEHTQSRIGATLWEAPMKYLENSPVFMADRVRTPLMMLHNDQDGAVPWEQGIEYYMALRRLGKEVYLFNYNGEGHGLNRKATRQDYTLRMQQFFDHHLKGAPAPEWMVKGVPYNDRDKEKEQWKKLFAPEKK